MQIHVQIKASFKPKDGTNFDALSDALDFKDIPCAIQVLGPLSFIVFVKGDTAEVFMAVVDALDFANIPSRIEQIGGAR